MHCPNRQRPFPGLSSKRFLPCLAIVASVVVLVVVCSHHRLDTGKHYHECIGYCWSAVKLDARYVMSFASGAFFWRCVLWMCKKSKTSNLYPVLLWCKAITATTKKQMKWSPSTHLRWKTSLGICFVHAWVVTYWPTTGSVSHNAWGCFGSDKLQMHSIWSNLNNYFMYFCNRIFQNCLVWPWVESGTWNSWKPESVRIHHASTIEGTLAWRGDCCHCNSLARWLDCKYSDLAKWRIDLKFCCKASKMGWLDG